MNFTDRIMHENLQHTNISLVYSNQCFIVSHSYACKSYCNGIKTIIINWKTVEQNYPNLIRHLTVSLYSARKHGLKYYYI